MLLLPEVLDASCCAWLTDTACWICACLWELYELLLLLLARVLRDPLLLSSISASLSRVLDLPDTVRVVDYQVVDIIEEVRVSLPIMAPVAVLLILVLVCTESHLGE